MSDYESAYDLLDQDDVWVTRDGRTIPVEDLSADQCRVLLAWYSERAGVFKAAEESALVSAGMPSGEAAFDMVLGGVMDFVSMTPEEWLSEQPLIFRLQQLAGEVAS